MSDNWTASDAYEAFMGRWSRRLAKKFVDWLDPEPGLSWLDVGCGTGALTAAVVASAAPARVVGCDPSATFVDHARRSVDSPQASFEVAGIDRLPRRDPGFDYVVSGLVLNFLPSPEEALRVMAAVLRPGGRVAAYVWDYSGRMDFLRAFWDETVFLDPAAASLDEGQRFPICREGALGAAFVRAGLTRVRQGELTIRTDFSDFADFWKPFENGTGPAPSYASGLDQGMREWLKGRLRMRLAPSGDGPIALTARAWTASGVIGGEQTP